MPDSIAAQNSDAYAMAVLRSLPLQALLRQAGAVVQAVARALAMDVGFGELEEWGCERV